MPDKRTAWNAGNGVLMQEPQPDHEAGKAVHSSCSALACQHVHAHYSKLCYVPYVRSTLFNYGQARCNPAVRCCFVSAIRLCWAVAMEALICSRSYCSFASVVGGPHGILWQSRSQITCRAWEGFMIDSKSWSQDSIAKTSHSESSEGWYGGSQLTNFGTAMQPKSKTHWTRF